MGTRRGLMWPLLVLVLAATACSPAVAHTSTPPPGTAAGARAEPYGVGVRIIPLRRGTGRPLTTWVWFPTDGQRVGAGRFPVILFSHGLHGSPPSYGSLVRPWVAAGFVVAAPAYPHTNRRARVFDRADVRNQPADAAYVLAQVLSLGSRRGDPLRGHLDATRVAAVGYSAGGYTTAGLLTARRRAVLRSAVVIAGAAPLAPFGGPSTPVLYVHGDADHVVPIERGRGAYAETPWPKGFLTVHGGDHGRYLGPGGPGADRVAAAVLDFLRWTLRGDADARRRMLSAPDDPATTLETAGL